MISNSYIEEKKLNGDIILFKKRFRHGVNYIVTLAENRGKVAFFPALHQSIPPSVDHPFVEAARELRTMARVFS